MSAFLMTEEGFNRLERALAAASLLASLGEGTGERMAVSFDAIAAIGAYVQEDIARAMADSAHTKTLDEQKI